MLDILTKDGLIQFLYTLPALLLSLSVHEYAHAWVAYKLGDVSQKIRGRLTLDPTKHIDPIGFICIALLGVGWGKPVMVDDRNFKDRAKGTMLTSLAGPLSNLLLAILLTVILKVLIMVGAVNLVATSKIAEIFVSMILLTIQFNVIFAVFNMIPLPPLDGSKVLFYFLPQKFRGYMYTLEKYSFVIILVLYMTNLTSYLIQPAYSLVLKFLMFILNL
ncbi:MAG: site-2 protease family protein [Clostridia bacterium]|nr:site-2 protease family protein [Clostridia bacterium]